MSELYECKADDIYRFAKVQGIKTHNKGNEIVFDICPYCKSEKDKHTFSINRDTGQFECKRASCQAKGNMITLAKDFGFTLSDEIDRYLALNTYRNKFKTFAKQEIEVRDNAIEYLKSRGISEEVCRKYQITVREDNSDVLVFPFFDEYNELTFIKYRDLDYKKGFSKAKEWCEKSCKPILFGMNLITDFSELVITEGQIDSLSVVESGYENAVSVPTGAQGFTWLPHCWDWLQKFGQIIVFGDCENGTVTLFDYLHARLGKKVKCVQPIDYADCKDANEILQKHGKEFILSAIDKARKTTSSRIKDISSVKCIDPTKLATLSTGISAIDNMLGGGIKIGQVVLQSGERGNGKSTWASQLVCEALSQGYNAFMYSGELPDFYVKNWIDKQISGKEFPSSADTEKINEWYADRLFLYNTDTITDEKSEMECLLETIEEAVVIKDCKFILIDNLMTVVSASDNESLYRSQSKFVDSLCKMAQKYQIFVMLIAHPRKKSGKEDKEFGNDDVSGSADITNRVDIVMSYDRVICNKEEVQDKVAQRKMSITKNRLFGKVTDKYNEIYLWFDDSSKRISDSNNFYKPYMADNNGFVSSEGQGEMEIPF